MIINMFTSYGLYAILINASEAVPVNIQNTGLGLKKISVNEFEIDLGFVEGINMLRIFFGDIDDVVYNTSVYFKYNYMPEWLQDAEVQAMILDVDKSKVLGSGAIDSPVLGVIAPNNLSGGVKTLILIDKVSDKLFNASNCGDNCAKWLLKMGKEKDITINLRHIMEFGDEPIEVEVLNTGEMVHSMNELIPIAGRYV